MAAEDRREPDFLLRERHFVALFEPGDAGHNTIVLSGVDVVVPLEVDIDGDPLTDDTLSLRSVHGLHEEVLSAGDPDVTVDPERRIAYYRFRLVPPGLYRLAVRVGAEWVELGSRLVVGRDGARWNGEPLSAAPPATRAAEAEGVVEDVEGDEPGDGCSCGGAPEQEHEHE